MNFANSKQFAKTFHLSNLHFNNLSLIRLWALGTMHMYFIHMIRTNGWQFSKSKCEGLIGSSLFFEKEKESMLQFGKVFLSPMFTYAGFLSRFGLRVGKLVICTCS